MLSSFTLPSIMTPKNWVFQKNNLFVATIKIFIKLDFEKAFACVDFTHI